MTGRWFKISIAFALLALITTGSMLSWGYANYTMPNQTTLNQVVVLTKGQGLKEIAVHLTKEGVISNKFIFEVGVRLGGLSHSLKAGEFLFPAGASMHEVAKILSNGITVVRKITIPEGLSSAEVVKILRQSESLHGDITRIPGEGTLLPNTYHYSYGDKRVAVLGRMVNAMHKTTAELWVGREQGLPLATIQQAVILASIVEKETSLQEERGRVASVFINRLRLGMRLQSDPTVIYGITGGVSSLGRPLRRADLEQHTPYNTYRNFGLPPTPIANPGYAALYAVLHPATEKNLYFVADGTGGHAFATTFSQHKRNIERWRNYSSQ